MEAIMSHIGLVWRKMAIFKKVAASSKKRIKKKPADPKAVLQGDAYFRLGMYQKAIKSYKDFIYNFPKNTNVEEAKYNIAECYEKLGKWENAIDAYQEYINAYPQGKRMAEAKEQINWIRAYNL